VEFDKCVEMFSNINEPLTTSPGLRYYCVTRRPSFMHCARPLGNQSSRCSRKWRVFRYPELCETICYTIFSNDKVPTDVYCNTGVGRGQCIAALAHPSCTGLVLEGIAGPPFPMYLPYCTIPRTLLLYALLMRSQSLYFVCSSPQLAQRVLGCFFISLHTYVGVGYVPILRHSKPAHTTLRRDHWHPREGNFLGTRPMAAVRVETCFFFFTHRLHCHIRPKHSFS